MEPRPSTQDIFTATKVYEVLHQSRSWTGLEHRPQPIRALEHEIGFISDEKRLGYNEQTINRLALEMYQRLRYEIESMIPLYENYKDSISLHYDLQELVEKNMRLSMVHSGLHLHHF